jgi:hypothetical protein
VARQVAGALPEAVRVGGGPGGAKPEDPETDTVPCTSDVILSMPRSSSSSACGRRWRVSRARAGGLLRPPANTDSPIVSPTLVPTRGGGAPQEAVAW